MTGRRGNMERDERDAMVRKLVREGESLRGIAEACRTSRTEVYRSLDRLGISREQVRVAKAEAPAPEAPKAPGMPQELTASLTAMTESFRALAETVKEQQQRLARVEKQFGLPNSAPSPERVRKAEPEEVGWPMDLNQRMDRESVDKAVSFHDL